MSIQASIAETVKGMLSDGGGSSAASASNTSPSQVSTPGTADPGGAAKTADPPNTTPAQTSADKPVLGQGQPPAATQNNVGQVQKQSISSLLQGQPANQQGVTTQAQENATANTDPNKTGTTNNDFESFINQYGGEEYIKLGNEILTGLLDSSHENVDNFLNTIAAISPEKHEAIELQVVSKYAMELQDHIINNILPQSEELQIAALQALKWDPKDYAMYRQALESGQLKSNQENPQIKALQDEIRQLKEGQVTFQTEKERAEQARIENERKIKFQEFRQQVTKPALEILDSLPLPTDEKGRFTQDALILASCLLGGLDRLCDEDSNLMSEHAKAQDFFGKGEEKLGALNSLSIQTGAKKHAQTVHKVIGDLLFKANKYDEMTRQKAQNVKDPIAVSQGAAAGNNTGTGANASEFTFDPMQPGGGRFSADRMKLLINQRKSSAR